MEVSDNSFKTFTALALVFILTGASLLFFKGVTPSFSSDDYVHLEKNIAFKDLLEAGDVFLHLDGREYRPLVRLSLWLNHRMGSTALPFHITNLLLHLGCIVCLFFLFHQFVDSRACALAGCLLFALHPIHTTNVHFIMGRTGMLCALFYFLSLLVFMLYAKRPMAGFYLLSLACFLFALLAKEEAVSLPIMLFFIMRLHPAQHFRKPILGNVMHLAPFFLLMSAYLAIRLFYWQDNHGDISVYTNYNWLNILKNYAKWIVGLIYPFDLYQARWALESRQFLPITVPAGIVCLFAAGLVYVLWPYKKVFLKNYLMVLSLLWFIVTLMPIMGGNAHRWYLYIPSASLSLFTMALWHQKPSGFRIKVFTVLFVTVTACYGLEVYKQSEIWSRQSQISQRFLKQTEQLGIHKLDVFHFINMPFGYKSAFLFTFNSFQNALAVKYGKKPQIKILSHFNIDDNIMVKVGQAANELTFHLETNAFTYFIFQDLQRTYPASGATITIDTYRIVMNSLSPAHTVRTYEIKLPSNTMAPVFYFDGRDIHKARVKNAKRG